MKYAYLPYFWYSPNTVEYLVHISAKNRLMFVEVPKAGCTIVKTVLQIDELGGRQQTTPVNIHDRSESPLLSVLDANLSSRRLFGSKSPFKRVAFVRNPFSRSVSCYLDKIVGDENERRIRLPYLGLPPDAEISFEEFLQCVKRQHDRKMDIHWAPQTHLLGLGRVRYDFIGRFEHLQADLLALMSRLGLEAPQEVIERATPHTTNASSQLETFYSQGKAASLVRQIYQRDFSHLGYGTSPLL